MDLNKRQIVRNEDQLTKCGWTPWHGETLSGWPVRTWVMGQTVFADGKVIDGIRGEEIQYQRDTQP